MYAESHGVTSDVIYDNKLNEVIEFSPEMFMLKPNITPIWTLNELAGKRHSAVLWTAGEFMYRGTKPGHVIPIDAAIPWKQHIDENLIPLLLRRECIHNLAMFHVNYDLVSRTYSPQSKQVSSFYYHLLKLLDFSFHCSFLYRKLWFWAEKCWSQFMDMLKDFDKMLQYLSEQLNKADLSDVTDIIIVSDHGIDTIHFHPENVDGDIIDLYRVIDPDSCDMYGTTVLQIIARPGHNQTELCAKLQQAAAFNGNYNVYTNDDLKTKKAHWHVYNEQRFGPCTAVANPGFAFQTIRDKLRKDRDYEKCTLFFFFIILSNLKRKYRNFSSICFILVVPGELIGRHGYDNFAPSMQAVFLANGPRFRCGIEIRSVHNIDLYHLFARLLNIQMHVPNLHIDGIDRPEIWTQMLNENVMKNE